MNVYDKLDQLLIHVAVQTFISSSLAYIANYPPEYHTRGIGLTAVLYIGHQRIIKFTVIVAGCAFFEYIPYSFIYCFLKISCEFLCKKK